MLVRSRRNNTGELIKMWIFNKYLEGNRINIINTETGDTMSIYTDDIDIYLYKLNNPRQIIVDIEDL
jgi:hypothetical protein